MVRNTGGLKPPSGHSPGRERTGHGAPRDSRTSARGYFRPPPLGEYVVSRRHLAALLVWRTSFFAPCRQNVGVSLLTSDQLPLVGCHSPRRNLFRTYTRDAFPSTSWLLGIKPPRLRSTTIMAGRQWAKNAASLPARTRQRLHLWKVASVSLLWALPTRGPAADRAPPTGTHWQRTPNVSTFMWPQPPRQRRRHRVPLLATHQPFNLSSELPM